MEKRLLRFSAFVMLILGSFMFYSNTGGPTNTDATGSPFDSNQNACRQCHTTFGLNSGTGSVTVNAPASYYPGETYTVTVTVEQSTPTPAKYGFQALALRDNNSAGGTITSGSGQSTWTSSGRTYVQHNSTTNTTGIWSFTWNAPSFADTVVFYAGGLAANGANGNQNDYVYTTTTTILPITPISFSKDSTSASCSNACDGAAGVTVSGGGTPPYTYAWSSGDTTSSIIGKCAGTYTVTITDDENHSEIAEVQIEQPNEIDLQFTTFPSSCAFGDGEISVIAQGGSGNSYSYQWNDSANTTDSVIFQSGTGWFTVTVTDGNGCTIIDSAEIITSTSGLSGIFQSENENCGNSNGTSSISMFAGNPPYTYTWSNGSTSSITTGLSAGTYSVTVTDNIGCIEQFSTEITEIFAVIDVLNTTRADASCFNGKNGKIALVMAEGTPPFNYSWSHDTLLSNAQQSNLYAGIYTITAEDAKGCVDSIEISVNQPDSVYSNVLVTHANEGFCDGTMSIEMFGGTPPYNYQWPHDNSITINEADELCPGPYLVTTTDFNECLYLVNNNVDEILSIEQVEHESFEIFPNPAASSIQVNSKSNGLLEIYDLSGSIVKSVSVSGKNLVDISNLDSGSYSITLKTKTGRLSKVLIIER